MRWKQIAYSLTGTHRFSLLFALRRADRKCGLLAACASAFVWLVADSAASQRQGHPLVPYWNAVVLLGFFWIVVYLLSALKPDHLHAIVDRALSLVKLEVARRHIDVVRQVGETLPALPVDKNKIEQVLVDVFMNALQAMSQGGTPTVRRCAAAAGERGSPGLTVEIDDEASITRTMKVNLERTGVYTVATENQARRALATAREYMESGGQTFIAKPVNLHSLIKCIEENMNGVTASDQE